VKIVFSNASLVWGGNEKWTLRAAETLSGRGHMVAIVIRDPEIWKGHIHSDAVEFIKLRFLNDADIGTVLALRKILKERDADIFLPTRSRDYWLGGFANWGLRSKYVMRMGITRTMPNTLKNRWRYGKFPDGIVVNAHAVKDSLIMHPWVDAKKIRVIYNGVDAETPPNPPVNGGASESPPVHEDFSSLPSVYGGAGGGDFLVIAAGRIETDKGFDILIDALAIAIRREPSIRGVIFGLGDQFDILERRIREHNIADRVRLGGFTKNLAGELRKADLAVSSSYREGVSNFILESWSAGCPLIATSIEGSAEIVTDGIRGRLIPPGNSEKMAEAILEAFRNPGLRSKWINEGKRAITETFNWNRMGEELENYFIKLLSDDV
jgi:glycosyltransferase involved in cell wall biosynthesis